MIKLQLLLRHPRPDPGIDDALRALLDGHGIRVTGCGRATLSAEMAPDDFARLFGSAPDQACLRVPDDLQDAITLITGAAPQCASPTPPKGNHAAL